MPIEELSWWESLCRYIHSVVKATKSPKSLGCTSTFISEVVNLPSRYDVFLMEFQENHITFT